MRPASANVTVRSSRSAASRLQAREYFSMEFPNRIKMYIQEESRINRPTLASIKRAKSLASIRLLAAAKMRVRPSKSPHKPPLYHQTPMEGRFSRDAFVVNPRTGSKELAVNIKS